MLPTPVVKQSKLSHHTVGLVCTFIALAFAAISLVFASRRLLPMGPDYLIVYSNFDSSSQRLAHKVLLCSLAVLGFLSPWLRIVLSRMLGPAHISAVNYFAARLQRFPLVLGVLLLPVFFWLYRGVGRDQYLLGLVLFSGVVLCAGRMFENRFVRLGCGTVLALYALSLLLSGFLGTYTFGAGLESALMHYYGLFGLAPLLATGGDILANTRIFYGLLPQTLLAIPQRASTLLQVGDYVLLVQISQVIFASLGLVCYHLFAPGGSLRALFCLGLWLPWISTAGGSIMGPTSSGLRFMNYPVAVLVLLCTARLPRLAQALVMGLAAGYALLYNLETGICVSLTFIGYSIIAERARDVWAMVRRLSLLLLGALASVGGFALVFRMGLGKWPVISISKLLFFANLFSAGFAGLPLHFDPLAMMLLLYPAYLVVRLTGIWLRAGLSERMRFKFSVSFLILVWMAYYFNRVHHWNLWTHTFLFTFLIIDLLPRPMNVWKDWKGLLALGDKRVPAMAFFLIFIIGPAFINTGLSELKVAWRSTAQRLALARDSSGMEHLSGLWVDSRCAQDIRTKSVYLAEASKEKRIVFVGANQFLLQLHTGIFFPLPVQDLFTESISTTCFLENVAALKAYAPEVILLDEMSKCQGCFPERGPFRGELVVRLAPDYLLARSANGWKVLERVGPVSMP